MFHFFSKVLVAFIHPLSWVILLLIIAVLSRRKKLKKTLLWSSLAILIVFSNGFLLNQVAKAWDIRKMPPSDRKYSCAIILGGFSSEGPDPQYGHFNESADRFLQGLKLWKQGRTRTLLVSGGNGNLQKAKFIEAKFATDQLKQFGLPDSAILVEGHSKNTLENARYSKKLLEERKLPEPYLLITSAFHMRRALKTFQSAGIDVIAYPCDFKAGVSLVKYDDFIPKAEILSMWNMYIKEMIGSVVYWMKS